MNIKEALGLRTDLFFSFTKHNGTIFDIDKLEAAWKCMVSALKEPPPNSDQIGSGQNSADTAQPFGETNNRSTKLLADTHAALLVCEDADIYKAGTLYREVCKQLRTCG